MNVEPKSSHQEHGSCSKCGNAPEKNPPVASAGQYTCPMHPQVVSDKPGSCPICGMALEAVAPGVTQDDHRELDDLTLRFWIGALLTLPVFLLAMGEMVPGLNQIVFIVGEHLSLWIQFALSTPVVLWAGWPFLEKAWRSVITRTPNMFTLISLGTSAAYLFSVVHLFFAHAGHANSYFEAAAVITVLALAGQVLELRARSKTSSAIRSLLALAPQTARRVVTEIEEEVPLEVVQVGDTLRVRPGDRVPVDGLLLEGHSEVNESMMTGEAMPVTKKP